MRILSCINSIDMSVSYSHLSNCNHNSHSHTMRVTSGTFPPETTTQYLQTTAEATINSYAEPNGLIPQQVSFIANQQHQWATTAATSYKQQGQIDIAKAATAEHNWLDCDNQSAQQTEPKLPALQAAPPPFFDANHGVPQPITANAVGTQPIRRTATNVGAVDQHADRKPQGNQALPEKIMQRVKANKKERRRTQSINHAFSELRKHIPDVPRDTKLSKIKTLRLAISYISHLMVTLEGDDHSGQRRSGAQAQIVSPSDSNNTAKDAGQSLAGADAKQKSTELLVGNAPVQHSFNGKLRNRDRRHRTGWPEIIWKSSSSLRRLEAQRERINSNHD